MLLTLVFFAVLFSGGAQFQGFYCCLVIIVLTFVCFCSVFKRLLHLKLFFTMTVIQEIGNVLSRGALANRTRALLPVVLGPQHSSFLSAQRCQNQVQDRSAVRRFRLGVLNLDVSLHRRHVLSW